MYKRIYIEITNICNLNCSFCPKNSREKQYMEVNNFKEILNKIKDETKHIYLHVMGEPLLHPNFDEILEAISKTDLEVNLTTNGLLLNKQIDLINNTNNIRKIAVSIQALEESNVLNFDEKLLTILNSLENLRDDIILEYRFWNHNKTVKAKQMTDIILKHYETKKHYPDFLTNNKYHNKIKLKHNTYIMYGETFTWPINGTNENQGHCQALKSQLGILVDGSVIPCCLDNEGKMILGNILESSLDEIRNSKFYQELLTNFRQNKRITNLCKQCNFNK